MQENVLWLQVTVDDAVRVQVLKRLRDVDAQLKNSRGRHMLGDQQVEAGAIDPRRGEEHRLAFKAGGASFDACDSNREFRSYQERVVRNIVQQDVLRGGIDLPFELRSDE